MDMIKIGNFIADTTDENASLEITFTEKSTLDCKEANGNFEITMPKHSMALLKIKL